MLLSLWRKVYLSLYRISFGEAYILELQFNYPTCSHVFRFYCGLVIINKHVVIGFSPTPFAPHLLSHAIVHCQSFDDSRHGQVLPSDSADCCLGRIIDKKAIRLNGYLIFYVGLRTAYSNQDHVTWGRSKERTNCWRRHGSCYRYGNLFWHQAKTFWE